jgi:anti-sigma factor RsiW
MTCEEAEVLLPLVADGALDTTADPALFAHLARCEQCQEALMRHDVVSLALTRSRPASLMATGPARRWRVRTLPWPVALAASLAAAAGLWGWLATLPRATPSTPALQVVQVPGPDGQPVYVVLDGDRMTVVDPRALDGRAPAAAQPPQAVQFKPTTPSR